MAEALEAARGGTNGLEKNLSPKGKDFSGGWELRPWMHRDQATPAELWAPLASF